MKNHARNGKFVRVAENLYRYSSSKTYYAVYRRDGKLVWRSLKTTDRDLAKRKLKNEIEAAQRIDPRQNGLTVESLLRMYEEQLTRFDTGTQVNRRSILNTFRTTWRYGLDLPVKDVTAAQLETWLAKHRGRIKRTSLNAYIVFLRQLFKIAISARALAESPAAGLRMLKPEEPIRDTPTWPQFQKLVKEIRRQKLNADAKESALLVEFMGLAGVGTAECANLKGEHIDLEAGKIWLFRSKTDTGYSIPVFPQLKELLERCQASGRLVTGQPVFKVRDPKKALTNACVRLGYPHFSTRSLRRCFITRAVELGVDFKTIASWQGHRDGGVLIAKTYSHLRSEHSDAMAQRLTSLIPT
jgi:integrase